MARREQELTLSPAAPLDRKRDGLAAGTIALLVLVLVLATQRFYGMSWDEGFYITPFRDVADWLRTLFTSPVQALSYDGILAGWQSIDELPPVTKWLGAVCLLVGGAEHTLSAIRFYPAVLFAVTCGLLYLLARRWTNPPVAVMGAILYGMHPRLFGHAHFAATETVFAFLTTLLLFLAMVPRISWRRTITIGVVLGLALATKVNGLILMVAVACWLLARAWVMPMSDPGSPQPSRGQRAKQDGLRLAVILPLAFAVAYLVWPWMWYDTAARIQDYIAFIREHSHQRVWFLGQLYNIEGSELGLVPRTYALVKTLVATPEVTVAALVAGVAGLVVRSAKLRGRFLPEDLLLGLVVVGPYAAMALPTSPNYDGVRLFLPVFAPLVLLATRLPWEWMASALGRPQWLVPALISTVAVASALPHWTSGLTYYNAVTRASASRGAEFPFETIYWGESITSGVMQDIESLKPNGPIRVKTLALHGNVFDLKKELGMISGRFEFNGKPPYDFHLMQNRKGFWGNAEWWLYDNRVPLLTWPEGADRPHVFLYDGQPPMPGGRMAPRRP